MGKSSTALKIIVSLLSLAVVLGAMEGVLRYRDPRYLRLKRGRKPVPFRVAHPVYGHGLRPGASGRTSYYGEYDVPYKINSLGLRDREFAREIPPGTVRILVTGDSPRERVSEHFDLSWQKFPRQKDGHPLFSVEKDRLVRVGR